MILVLVVVGRSIRIVVGGNRGFGGEAFFAWAFPLGLALFPVGLARSARATAMLCRPFRAMRYADRCWRCWFVGLFFSRGPRAERSCLGYAMSPFQGFEVCRPLFEMLVCWAFLFPRASLFFPWASLASRARATAMLCRPFRAMRGCWFEMVVNFLNRQNV